MRDNDGKIQRELIFPVVIITNVLVLAVALSNFTHAQEPVELHQKTLDVISNHTSSEQYPHITVGKNPVDLAVNLNTNKIYVANNGDNTVSVIDAENNTKIGNDIKVGRHPGGIGVISVCLDDECPDRVYVANSDDGTVSVIDAKNNTKLGNDIKVGNTPGGIAVQPLTNTVYVANSDDGTVSVIDGAADKVVAKVMFNIEPFNAGHIECDRDKLIAPIAQQFYIWSGSECTAKPNQGFEFVSWHENLGDNSTQLIQFSPSPSFLDSVLEPFLDVLGMKPDRPESKLNITKFGSFTANFKALPPPIPTEYVATLVTVVATAFIGTWLTPTIISWRKAKKEGRRVRTHHLIIKSLYEDGKVDEKDIPRLDKLKDDIMDDYANGNISEQHYNNLNDKISVLYEEIYKKKIDLLNGKDLDKVKDEINDSYAKGKISEQHYKLLNEKLSDNKNIKQSNNNQLASSFENSTPAPTTKGSPIKIKS